MTEFKVGDRVSAFGLEGIVTHFDDTCYPVRVKWSGEIMEFDSFTRDGRFKLSHKEPSLKLIERPKKKVKKFGYTAIITSDRNRYTRLISNTLYDSEEAARSDYPGCFIALGPKIEWEEDDK